MFDKQSIPGCTFNVDNLMFYLWLCWRSEYNKQ